MINKFRLFDTQIPAYKSEVKVLKTCFNSTQKRGAGGGDIVYGPLSIFYF